AAAKTKEPVREGTVAMLGPLIDTLIICSLTGLAIISTGAYNSGLNGSPLTALAFEKGLSPIISWGNEIITFAVLLFALSTAITWSYYGDRSAEYLFGKKSILPYKLVYVLFHFIGAIVSLEIVWGFGDIANGLMAIPNLIALILLAPVVVKMTKKYYSNLDNN
ncbi:MAG: alanine:cation symporter family protein, partial [Candidatus Marinimicrobia bacterium]|nr:alanine:cation symporter family protein [Candidatus Neomarinimicrobiota bacterium]